MLVDVPEPIIVLPRDAFALLLCRPGLYWEAYGDHWPSALNLGFKGLNKLRQLGEHLQTASGSAVCLCHYDFARLQQDMLSRQQLRTEMRQRRQALSAATQHSAALALCQQILSQPDIMRQQHFALYLSNDAEINTSPLINALLNANKQLYLPVLHPFVSGYLLFQHYLPSMPMRTNKFGIAEPVWHCQHIKPVAELDVIFTPLVAFDDRGQRLGMGGGFYDRTLAPLNHLAAPARTPQLIGLAHNCQQWPELPIAPWDQPMAAIATPSHFWRFNAD